MASLCANHAMSVFKNSCRSSPAIKGPSTAENRPKTASDAKASSSLPNLTDIGGSNCNRPKTADDNWSGPALPRPPLSKSIQTDTSRVLPPSTEETCVKPPDDNYSTLFQTLLESNSLLHKEISRLRRDHKKAMYKLTNLSHDYESAKRRDEGCTHTESRQPRTHVWQPRPEVGKSKKTKNGACSPRYSRKSSKCEEDVSSEEEFYEHSVVYDTPEEFNCENSSEAGDSDKLSVLSIESYHITYISSSSSSLSQEEEDHYAAAAAEESPGALVVGRMWEDFSVEDYPVEDFSEAFPGSENHHGDKSGKGKEWTPRVTVPEPFSMTVREANSLKKKTRSTIQVEKDQEEREAAHHVHTRKKFRAAPVPANTFLPLYDLINAKNEQRKELVKKMSSNMLKASQKPFKFSKRDEERRQQKSEWLKQSEELETVRLKEKVFRAKPVPLKVLDPEVEAEALEKEEYRKIRIRMRAEELLTKSKAPYSMRLQKGGASLVQIPPPPEALKNPLQERHRSPSGHTRNNIAKNRFTFQPRITHKIPDYNKSYSKFQQQLLLKKQSKLTTVSEPFNLHTEKRAAKSSRERQPVENGGSSSSARCYPGPAAAADDEDNKLEGLFGPPSYPPTMTETVRRRQVLAQERLAEALERESAKVDREKARKRREKNFQKIVAKKTLELCLDGDMLEDKKKHKLQEFR